MLFGLYSLFGVISLKPMTTIITIPDVEQADKIKKLNEMGATLQQISLAATKKQSFKWVKETKKETGPSRAQALGETTGRILTGGTLKGVIGLLTEVAVLTIPGLGLILIIGLLVLALGLGSLGLTP